MSEGRNLRFVRAAKRLLLFQTAAAAAATALAGWAAVEVVSLVRERDSLAVRVAELESTRLAGLPAQPAYGEVEPVLAQSEPPAASAAPPDSRSGGRTAGGSTTSGGTASGGTASGATTSGGTTSGGSTSGGTTAGGTNSSGTASGGTTSEGATSGSTTSGGTTSSGGEGDAPRNCRSVDRQPITCVPPYRRTPVPGVCLDARNRLMRCPRQVREPDRAPPDQNQQQPDQQQQRPLGNG